MTDSSNQIYKVIKRNGRKVAFNPDKLNKLASFASDTSNVSWSDIALSAVSKLHDLCTVHDITNALIQSCIDAATEDHLKVAGRLYAAKLRKDVFPDKNGNPPPLKDYLVSMTERGFYIPFYKSYTDEELQIVDSWLNHDRDFTLNFSQVNQFVNKYLVRSITSKQVYETPQFLVARLVLTVFEKHPERMKWIKNAIESFNGERISLPSPMLSNFGTVKKTGTSCCLYFSQDSTPSIAASNHISELMTVAGAGLGLTMHVRSKGDPIRQGTIEHQGKIPYYRAAQGIVKSNKQGCYSSDTEVLTDKGFIPFSEVTEDTYIAQVHPSLEIEYIKPTRVIAYKHTGDMYQFKSDYLQGVDVLVTPDHHMIYTDIGSIQEGSPITFKEELAENFSPSYNTMFFTSVYNYLEDSSFTNTSFNTLNVGDSVQYIITSNKNYINRDGDRLTLSVNNIEQRDYIVSILKLCEYTDVIEVTPTSITFDLNSNVMFRHYKDITNPYIHSTEYNNDLLYLVLKATVSVCDSIKFINDRLVLCNITKEDREFVKLVQDLIPLTSLSSKETDTDLIIFNTFTIPTEQVEITKVDYDDMVYCVEVPTNVIVVRRNGYVLVCGNSRGGALTVYTPVLDPEIKQIIKARNPATPDADKLPDIDQAYCYNQHFIDCADKGEQWMLVSKLYAPKLWELFFVSEDKLHLFVEEYNRVLNDDSIPKTMIDARDLIIRIMVEEREVNRLYAFDATRANTHTPFKDKIYSSNLCNEIYLPTAPFKSILELYDELSSEYIYLTLEDEKEQIEIKDIELSKEYYLKWINDIPFTHEGKNVVHVQKMNEIALCNIAAINLQPDTTDEQYFNDCYILLSFIDYVIDNSEFPFPNVAYTAKARRSAGVGMNNLAYVMAKNKLYYSSKSGKEFIFNTAERHLYMLLKASQQLAQESGEETPWMYKTKWGDGWLPFDTGYTQYTRNITKDFKYKYDWEPVRAELKAGRLPRHSTLVAHMPCESSSITLKSTNSLYPIRQGVIIKRDGNKANNAQVMPEYESLQYYYENAFDLHYKHLVELYAIVQIFDDQGISSDFYISDEYDEKGVKKDLTTNRMLLEFTTRALAGLKGHYYINNKSDLDEAQDTKGCSSGACDV